MSKTLFKLALQSKMSFGSTSRVSNALVVRCANLIAHGTRSAVPSNILLIYQVGKKVLKNWTRKWLVSSWSFLSFWEVNFDAVFNDLFASLFLIKLRNLVGNLVSLNIDWVLENILKVLRHNLTPLFKYSCWPHVVWKMVKTFRGATHVKDVL